MTGKISQFLKCSIFSFQSDTNHTTCKCFCISVYMPNNTEQLVQTAAEITAATEKATMIHS